MPASRARPRQRPDRAPVRGDDRGQEDIAVEPLRRVAKDRPVEARHQLSPLQLRGDAEVAEVAHAHGSAVEITVAHDDRAEPGEALVALTQPALPLRPLYPVQREEIRVAPDRQIEIGLHRNGREQPTQVVVVAGFRASNRDFGRDDGCYIQNLILLIVGRGGSSIPPLKACSRSASIDRWMMSAAVPWKRRVPNRSRFAVCLSMIRTS